MKRTNDSADVSDEAALNSTSEIPDVPGAAILDVIDIEAGYGTLPILQGVCLSARPGSLVAVLGPNGSGKSTLLKTVIGLLKPTRGQVRLDGTDMAGLPPHIVARRGIGYVPQIQNVFWSLTVRENLELGGATLGANAGARLEGILTSFPDLAAASKKRAGTLSGGQRNILGVARALMLDPKVLLVDEPTAGLSPTNADLVWDALETVARSNTAVVVVEQSVDAALSRVDSGYVLTAGRNRLHGTAAELREADLESIFLGGYADSPADTSTD
jgi:ABC-type branched-subunit amino acid transport system ATPase component